MTQNRIEALFPGGKRKTLTFSYDDGLIDDRRLIGIFNRHGLKGTFHLNSGLLGTEECRVKADEVAALYAGHEISCHSLTHPFLERQAPQEMHYELLQDRINLERLAGYPVVGMSYPYGSWNDTLIEVMKGLGFAYSRTCEPQRNFRPPKNFLEWHPTCHHNDPRLSELGGRLREGTESMAIMYVWGHSFEFQRQNTWELIEKFAAEMAGHPDIWYATNIEICRYCQAIRRLVVGAERKMVLNPSGITVTLRLDGKLCEVKPGELLRW